MRLLLLLFLVIIFFTGFCRVKASSASGNDFEFYFKTGCKNRAMSHYDPTQSCGDTKMLSITVAVVSVILVVKDIVGKKLSHVRLSIYFQTSLLLNSNRSMIKSPSRKPIFFSVFILFSSGVK